jgi:hypothetical protein
LVAAQPDVLGGEQIDSNSPRRWLLVSREMGVPDDSSADRWSVDLVFLDQDGVATLVEVKRSSDSRIRREVVGQMLDYAANVTVHWPTDRIRSVFEGRCREDDKDPDLRLRELLDGDSKADKLDTAGFWHSVESNLRANRIRMLFVSDSIPSELQRIVEFLNEVMTPTEVLAVEVRRLVSENANVLVSRVIGQTEAAKQRKGRAPGPAKGPEQVSAGDFVAEVCERAIGGSDTVAPVYRLLAWSHSRHLECTFRRGPTDTWVLIRLRTDAYRVTVMQIRDRGVAWLYMKELSNRSPFDQETKRDELLGKLKDLPGFSLAAKRMLGYPRLDLAKLGAENRLEELVEAMDWLVNQLKA